MSSPYVREKVIAKLQVAMGTTDVIDSSNRTIRRAADDSIFVAVRFPVSSEALMTIGEAGNNNYREEGMFEVIVCVQSGRGTAEALTKIETIRSNFRAKEADGIRYYTASPGNESSFATNEGEFYALSTAIEYDYDYFA